MSSAFDASGRDAALPVDTGPIGWLLPGIAGAFDAGVAALRAFRPGTADVDLASLRVAQSHLHQAHGALGFCGVAGVARVGEAIEALLAHFEGAPERCDATALDAVAGGCRAIVEYLEDLQAGAPQQPLRLYPGYRALLAARGVERIHPAELFPVDLGVRVPHDATGKPLDNAALREQRAAFEQALLGYLRNERDSTALAALARAAAAIDGSVGHAPQREQGAYRAFWWVAHALFDALAHDGYADSPDQQPHLKRLAGRINLQIRKLVDGSTLVPERLFGDTLFFVAIAAPVTPQVREVQARYALASAKAAWSAIVSGDVARIAPLANQTDAVVAALQGKLRAAEKGLDRFFGDPADRAVLPSVQEALAQASATPALRGHDDVRHAIDHARASIARFVDEPDCVDPAGFEELAETLVAVGFYVDQVGRGRVDAGAFRFDAASGRLAADPVGTRAVPAEVSTVVEAVESPPDDFVAADGDALPAVPDVAPFPAAPPARDDDIRRIGSLTLSMALFNVFLTEADELLRVLTQDFAEWRHALDRDASDGAIRAAHSLAGSSATVGLASAHDLAAGIEDVLQALWRGAVVLRDDQVAGLQDAVESLRKMLHRFAAERIPEADPVRLASLVALRREIAGAKAAKPTVEAAGFAAGGADALDDEFENVAPLDALPLRRRTALPDIVANVASAMHDDLDPELLDVFVEEGREILPQIGTLLRAWQAEPADAAPARMLLRHLHTLKGSARMAGAMRLGEVTHEIEARVESAARLVEVPASLIDELLAAHDRSLELFDRLHRPTEAEPVAATEEAGASDTVAQDATPALAKARSRDDKQAAQPAVRVNSETLDRLVNLAGEVSISRARIENEVLQIKGAMSDLNENVERLRAQLREIELQADFQLPSQMPSQMQSQQATGDEREKFDPLEFDRFTRFQELTRMMAESVNDVKTVQQHLQKSLDAAETDLASQRRMTRDLQQDLMRVRMVPFSSIAERLYRVARLTAKELDKRVNLDIRGGSVEIDRSVLERMAGPFEHLLRNHIFHGIESREARRAAGKDETGELLVEVRQEGNEIVLTFSDDGAGLDYARIREKGRALGWIDAHPISDAQAAELIFQPGFSTASEVTELAGRGIGMDVVRAEALVLAGRVSVDTTSARGARFTINLPLTLAIAQVVLVAVAGRVYALPAVLVEQVQQLRPQSLADAYRAGHLQWAGARVRLAFLGTLLGIDDCVPVAQRASPVLILRSAGERIAIHVDEVVGNQEVVVKNLGPQLSRMVGIAGATVLGSGQIVLILNPVQLAQMTRAQEALLAARDAELAEAVVRADGAALKTLPTVMVVDDSLTVRRITQRLLSREGYQVVLAKDGVDALEQLHDYAPDVMLVDIEMPRMDGFDLTRNVRNDERYRHIPIVMITSRTAEKHRRHAAELGVDAYLGKPYQEEELLELLAKHVRGRRGHPA